jgi:sarcosine oxidase subunit beta
MATQTKRLWKTSPLKPHYDVVLIGGGIHGLATAYYLAKNHGITDVAVLERRYVGYGASGRNTAIVRANQRTQENVRLNDEGLKLWPQLTDELDFNLMFHNCGNLNLAHSEAAVSGFRHAISTANFCGVESELMDPQQCKELVPELDISERPFHPIQGGMYHPPGGILRHDAVVWGLAKGACQHGVHIHQGVEVSGIDTDDTKITGVQTSQGAISCNKLGVMAGGYGASVCSMVGMELPVHPLTIQAMVTQPLKPFLHHVISSGAYHCYANQTLKGEVVTGAHMDPQVNYSTDPTAHYIKHQAEMLTDILPCLKGVRFMRIWAGLADMTPDMAPILDGNVMYDGLYIDVGWGYFGFKSGPITGKYMAEFLAREEAPDILKPFALNRFIENRYMGETAGATNYGHWN